MKQYLDFFKGLSRRQIEVIRHCSQNSSYLPGDVIVREGESAKYLYIILSGLVQVYRQPYKDKIVEIARLETGEFFGEMGLLNETQIRTASVRAMEKTAIFEICDPVKLSKRLDDVPATIHLMENLIRLVARKLDAQNRNAPVESVPPHLLKGKSAEAPEGKRRAIRDIEAVMPRGFKLFFRATKRLKAGAYLCNQNDPPNGFYFIRAGRLEALLQSKAGMRRVGITEAPGIAGELGFFSDQPRIASLRALEPVTYTFFSRNDYRKLLKTDPMRALKMISAVALLSVHLLSRATHAQLIK